MTINEFSLKVPYLGGYNTVLFIGFDGTATLLGHSLSSRFERDLYPDINGQRNPRMLNQKWSEMEPPQKRAILMKHTAPSESPSAAVRHIAQLLKDRHVHAVVATDPHGALYNSLRDFGVQMNRFDLSESRPEVLERIKLERANRVAFLDGSDCIFEFRTSLADPRKGENEILQETLIAVKQFLHDYRTCICWGWCDLNRNLDTLLDGAERQIFLLGSYTVGSDAPLEADVCEVLDHQEQFINDELLTALGRYLWPNGVQHEGARSRRRLVVDGSEQIISVSTALLWSEGACADIADKLRDRKLVVIGVEGRLVRARVARQVNAGLGNDGATVLTSQPDLSALLRLLKMYSISGIEATVLADFNGSSGPAPPHFASILRQCRDLTQLSNLRLAVFAPPTWTEALQREQWVYAQSLHARNCMTSDVIYQWVYRLLLDLIESSTESMERASRRLAAEMALPVSPPSEQTVDLLHEALDLWRTALLEELAHGRLSADTFEETCPEVWSRIAASFADPGIDDFDMSIKVGKATTRRGVLPDNGKGSATTQPEFSVAAKKKDKPKADQGHAEESEHVE